MQRRARKKPGDTLHKIIIDFMHDKDVPFQIKALSGPDPETGRYTFWWQSDFTRHKAAQHLGKLRDPRAVDPLIQVLDDPDRTLCRKAVWALGAIGDRRAASALIPLLADVSFSNKLSTLVKRIAKMPVQKNPAFDDPATRKMLIELESAPVAKALSRLGEGKLITCFYKALLGDSRALSEHLAGFRDGIVRALIKALNPLPDVFIANAALALADLGVIEALPEVRSKALLLPFRDGGHRQLWGQAILELESLSSLPRSSENDDDSDTETLPRVAGQTSESTDLPRATLVNERDSQ